MAAEGPRQIAYVRGHQHSKVQAGRATGRLLPKESVVQSDANRALVVGVAHQRVEARLDVVDPMNKQHYVYFRRPRQDFERKAGRYEAQEHVKKLVPVQHALAVHRNRATTLANEGAGPHRTHGAFAWCGLRRRRLKAGGGCLFRRGGRHLLDDRPRVVVREKKKKKKTQTHRTHRLDERGRKKERSFLGHRLCRRVHDEQAVGVLALVALLTAYAEQRRQGGIVDAFDQAAHPPLHGRSQGERGQRVPDVVLAISKCPLAVLPSFPPGDG